MPKILYFNTKFKELLKKTRISFSLSLDPSIEAIKGPPKIWQNNPFIHKQQKINQSAKNLHNQSR
jgi:hypothetical protein